MPCYSSWWTFTRRHLRNTHCKSFHWESLHVRHHSSILDKGAQVPPFPAQRAISQHCITPEILDAHFFLLLLQTPHSRVPETISPLSYRVKLMLFSSPQAQHDVFCLNQFSQLIYNTRVSPGPGLTMEMLTEGRRGHSSSVCSDLCPLPNTQMPRWYLTSTLP